MDTLVIEHLACLEINRIILQEPYRLVSEIQFNDKSASFDGEIIVYNSDILKKENIEGSVKIQIKGTTINKKIKSNKKISHSVKKIDLEVYKKMGVGVLYFVVTINKDFKTMQGYYNALTPLEIQRLLNILEKKGQDSLSIDFKLIQDGALEQICKVQLDNVKKQPSYFIELSKNKDFDKYKIEYTIMPTEQKEFSFFDNVGYVYGIEGKYEMPIKAIVADTLQVEREESIVINGEKINIGYCVTESKSEISIEIEDTLSFLFFKEKKLGNLNIKRLLSLNAYIKACKIIKYILEYKELPFEIYKISSSINQPEKFRNINEEIEKYENLLKICERIGISGDYEFNENEDLDELFTGIYNIFQEQKYELINNGSEKSNQLILRLKLSKYISLLLFKDEKDNMYYNIFDDKVFNRLAAFIPKKQGEFISNEDDCYNVSIYSVFQFKEELLSLTNFDFETYKKSFEENRHNKGLEENNQIALDLISAYDNNGHNEYLKLAIKLFENLIENNSTNNEIYKVNLIQTRKRINMKLENNEEDYLYELLENSDNEQLKLVVNIILGLKKPADRILEKLNDEQKLEVSKWPIYNLYDLL